MSVEVAICICTYQRPRRLADLLGDLASSPAAGAQVSLVVVDNDVLASAQPVVERHRQSFQRIAYDVESERSYSAVRNRSVRNALELDADYVVFLDDDERAPVGWLDALLRAVLDAGAAAVAGPVIPQYEDGVPTWVIRGGFFDRPRDAVGGEVRPTGIANVLVRADVLASFDEPFGRTFADGSEDWFFLERLRDAGIRVVAAPAAVVYEMIPRERSSARWLLARAFRSGRNFSRCQRELGAAGAASALRAAKCAARLVQGLVLLVPSLAAGRAGAVRALSKTLSGAGGLAGLADGARSRAW